MTLIQSHHWLQRLYFLHHHIPRMNLQDNLYLKIKCHLLSRIPYPNPCKSSNQSEII